jgi:aminoglycoside 6-adenylyltransferase
MITYQGLEDAISLWAREQPDVRAVLVIGSRAQEHSTVDQYSDLDLVVYTSRPISYDRTADWLSTFGEIWLAVRSRTGRGDREWLVLFAGGVKADFVIVPAVEGHGLTEMLERSAYIKVFRRGIRVLYDRDGAASGERLQLDRAQSEVKPTVDDFELAVNRLILATARAAKFVSRGDLWRSQQQINVEVRQALLTLIEWQAILASPADKDIWHSGRFIEAWADPHVVRKLPELFAGYDEADLRDALSSALDLAEWIAEEIAGSLELPFPAPVQAKALSWTRELLGR